MAATSSTNAWAVGSDSHGGVIEHWNGKAWKIQAEPETRLSSALGRGRHLLDATPGRWATPRPQARDRALERQVLEDPGQPEPELPTSTPSPGSGPDEIPLMGVAATSSTNAWAVGYGDWDLDDDIFESRTLIEHWNGKAWKIQPSPNELSSPPREGVDDGLAVDNQFYAVAATSSTDAWAVGWPIKGASIWQWNGGKAWKAQASPKRGAALYAVAAKSSNVWAVGADYGTAYNRYDAFAGYDHPHKGLAVHCVSSSSG